MVTSRRARANSLQVALPQNCRLRFLAGLWRALLSRRTLLLHLLLLRRWRHFVGSWRDGNRLCFYGKMVSSLVFLKKNMNFQVTSIISARSIIAVTLSLRNLVAFLGVVERRVASLVVSRRRWWRRLGRSVRIDLDGANASSSDRSTGVVVVVWRRRVGSTVLGAVLVFFGAVGRIVVFRSAVQGVTTGGLAVRVASTVLVFFRSVIGGIVVFRCRRVD